MATWYTIIKFQNDSYCESAPLKSPLRLAGTDQIDHTHLADRTHLLDDVGQSWTASRFQPFSAAFALAAAVVDQTSHCLPRSGPLELLIMISPVPRRHRLVPGHDRRGTSGPCSRARTEAKRDFSVDGEWAPSTDFFAAPALFMIAPASTRVRRRMLRDPP